MPANKDNQHKAELLKNRIESFIDCSAKSMDENIFNTFRSYVKSVEKYYIDVTDLVVSWYDQIHQYNQPDSRFYESFSELMDKLENRLKDEKLNNSFGNLIDAVKTFIKEINEQLLEIPSIVTLGQEEIHFLSVNDKKIFSKIRKAFKRNTYKFFRSIVRLFRGKKFNYSWKRNFNLRNLLKIHLHNEPLRVITSELLTKAEKIGLSFEESDKGLKELAGIIFNVFKSNSYDPSVIRQAVDGLKNDISEKIEQLKSLEADFILSSNRVFEQAIDTTEKLFDLAGTIDFPNGNISDSKVNRISFLVIYEIDELYRQYSRFFNAILEKIEFFEDVMWYNYSMIYHMLQVIEHGSNYHSKFIKPLVEKIETIFTLSTEKIKTSRNLSAAFIESEKKYLRQEVDEDLAIKFIDALSQNELASALADFISSIESHLEEFSYNYQFVRHENLKISLQTKDVKQFAPKEIISLYTLKALRIILSKVRTDLNKSLEKLSSSVIELGRIVEFTLDSAVTKLMVDQNDMEEASRIACAGIQRATSRSRDISNSYTKFVSEIKNTLADEIAGFYEDLSDLTNINKLLTLRIQYSKDKFRYDSKLRLVKAIKQFDTTLNFSKDKLVLSYKFIKDRIGGIRSKVGLSQQHAELSDSLADYLMSVKESLDKLPYVYQRLFSDEKISDERIFIGRSIELEKLISAIDHWQKGNMDSIVIVGEKGSGTSSLINMAIKRLDLSENVIRKEFLKTVCTETQLVNELKLLFGFEQAENFNSLVDSINSLPESKIVVIENLEDFFLRVVNGFEAINKLSELITKTNKKILWISTCNQFAWIYLNKIMNLQDYFIHRINLEDINQKSLHEIIYTRHRISGYRLIYSACKSIAESKSYKKLDEESKQSFLEQRYFDSLKKYCSNNISLALFFWLRSIESIDEQSVMISTEDHFDYSFLKNLSDQKLFALAMIVLHDGLTIEENSRIFNSSLTGSELLFTSLYEDGIIFKKGNRFKINFQLYRPVVNQLQDKNILH